MQSMEIKALNKIQQINIDNKLSRIYSQFEQLLIEIKKHKLSQNCVQFINERIDILNLSNQIGSQQIKLIKQKQTEILKKIEKEHKLVPKNHYKTLWMLFGMSGIGLPIGVAFGLSIGKFGLLGLGLPVGMAIGVIFGVALDKKAFKEGRQLDIEIKY